ncbi:hypothetical protein Tco_1159116 [Tanacetum coccineum]
MSSSSSHATVTYTFVSPDTDLPSWGIPLLEAYESEPEAPLSPVPAPEYPEYLAPSDDDIPAKDQPVYQTNQQRKKFKGGSRDGFIDYAADEEEESSEDEEEEDNEEHLAPTDSALSVPYYTRLRRARISVRPYTPPSPSTKARIAEYASAPTPPSPSPSPLSPLSSPLLLIPSPQLLLPSLTRRDIIPEADMPLQKRARFTALTHRFEIGESSAAATARQTGPTLARGIDYGFIDTLDASILATNERVMTALEGVNGRKTELGATHRHDSEEFYTRHQNAQDDRALLRARISTLERERERERERRYFRFMSFSFEREALYARQAWAYFEGRSQTIEAQIRALHAEVRVLHRQRIDNGDKLTRHIQHEHDRFRELERTRDAERQDGPADAGSSSQGVADALADYEANRSSGNGHDS